MEEARIVYKRNSAWWFATCYLTGSFFLLCYGLLSVVGLLFDLGSGGVEFLKEAQKDNEAQRYAMTQLKRDVTLLSYNITTENNQNKIAVSIRNDSQYAIDAVHIEIAYLDQTGVPVDVTNERLSRMDTVYPGDTAHGVVSFPIDPQYQNTSMAVRLARFNVVDETSIADFCKRPS